ncbi:hypothetical protein ACIBO2_37225 [Nonomuraea sp. NPDC050022]|uniref:hypothetical protein n=1 Tax=unclassified Nonomuraea TaxID=2593643 RepID=UPI0033F91642
MSQDRELPCLQGRTGGRPPSPRRPRLIALLPGTANATPSSGVNATVRFQRTGGDQDYILREITVEPGGSTGWHYHDGVIRMGTLSHFDFTCESDGVYQAGQTIIEHSGQHRGDKPVVMEVLYVIPHGAPLSVDAPNPGCDFQEETIPHQP